MISLWPVARRLLGCVVACGFLTASFALAADQYEASAGADESFDSNVDQYDFGDRGTRASMVSHAMLKLSAALPRDNVSIRLAYQPEYSVYHQADSENHFKHALTGKIGAVSGRWTIDSTTALTHIDGSDEGLIYAGPGGAPCFGGIAVRDRRDQWLGKENLSIKYAADFGFIRGVGYFYWHDFLTEQKAIPGYQNYADRAEVIGGVDVGFPLTGPASVERKPNLFGFVGYRYGQQYQDEVLDNPIQFSNNFHRILLGVEGQAARRLKLNADAGPDFRNLGPQAPDNADDAFTRLYLDASATFILSERDELTLQARRFDQPNSGGRGLYTDILYSARYSRKFSKDWSASVEARMVGCDVEKPSERDDWIVGANLSIQYSVSSNVSLSATYQFDDGESDVPDSAGREFQRHLVTLGANLWF